MRVFIMIQGSGCIAGFLSREILSWQKEDDILAMSLWQLEDEELPWFDRIDIVGVMELTSSIKGVGGQRQPVRQGDG